MRHRVLRKIFSVISCFSLLFQTFLPFSLATPAYAEEETPAEISVVETAPITEPTPETSQSTPTETITPTPEVVAEPTIVIASQPLAPDLDQGESVAIQTEDINIEPSITPEPTRNIIPEATATPEISLEVVPTIEPTPEEIKNNSPPEITSQPSHSGLDQESIQITPPSTTSSEQNWTYKNISLNTTYTAPQNNKVKITFTKLPNNSGNILIKEIKLTEDQIKETGSLSDTAYDITSNMVDGTFAYKLELPIPESVKNVGGFDIRYTEDINSLTNTQSLENKKIESDKVIAENIDHFTVYIVVASWNFNDENTVADGGLSQNLAKNLSVVGATGYQFYTGASGAPGDSAVSAMGWNNGQDLKYWQVEINSLGHKNLKLFSRQRSSNTGPRDFKIQYKIGDEGSWTDISSSIVTTLEFVSGGMLTNLSLPSSCDNQSLVYIRWIMSSNFSVENSMVESGGTNRIDNIEVDGDPMETACSDGIDNDGDGNIDNNDADCNDTDQDGISDNLDNCPNTANSNQSDSDADGIGNTCDNCPSNSNPDQTDADGDRLGDCCDNCQQAGNANQLDDDADGIGNVCDPYMCRSTGTEVCGDGVDNDCDGFYDEGCTADITAPVVGAITISPSYTRDTTRYISGLSTISAPVSDEASGSGINITSCRYSVNNGAGSFVGVTNAYNASQGICIFENVDTSAATGIAISVDDNAGNWFNTTSSWVTDFVVDTTAPTGNVSDPSVNGQVQGTAGIVVSTQDDGSYVNHVCLKYGVNSPDIEIDCMDLSEKDWNSWPYAPSFSYSWDTTLVTDGDYKLFGVMTDNMGNVGTTDPVNIIINNFGVGTSGNPAPITSCQDFQNINQHLGWHYEIKNNINCSETKNWNNGRGFLPIGSSSSSFTGSVDGKNFNISDLYMDTQDNSGVFNSINSGAVITGVNFLRADISCGSTYCGGFSNLNFGTIEKSSITGTLLCSGKCGGLASQNSGLISQSWVDMNISNGGYTGIIAGQNYSGRVENCYVKGSIIGSQAGGIAGLNENTNIYNSYSIALVSDYSGNGGLIGWQYQGGSQTGSYWDIDTSGHQNMCGVDGSDCDNTHGLTDTEMKIQSNFVGWDFENIWRIDSTINSGYPYFSWQSFITEDDNPSDDTGDNNDTPPSNSNNQTDTNSPASAPVCTDTKPGSAPRLISAIASGPNEVTLTWTKALDPVSYYLVAYGNKSGELLYGNPNVGGAGTTSYTVKGLSGGQRYYFKVRAGNNCMPGDYSNEMSAFTSGINFGSQAENFLPGVLGSNTDEILEATPAAEISNALTPTPTGEVLAKSSDEKGNLDYLWLLLFIPLYFGLRRVFKKK